MNIKAPKGLGDAIYLRAVALHLLDIGVEPRIYTVWPEVYADLGVKVFRLADFTADGEPVRGCFYCLFCDIDQPRSMDQFSMLWRQAGLKTAPVLRMDWKISNKNLVERVHREARGRPILIYQPLKRANNDDQQLLRPRPEAFHAWLANARRDYFMVRIGNPQFLQADTETFWDMDLLGRTTIQETFDLGLIGDHFFGESCFIQIMAEAMDKPFTMMFSRRGLESDRPRVRGVRPERVVLKQHLLRSVYDE